MPERNPAIGFALTVLLASVSSPAFAACDDLLPPVAPASETKRPVTADDILRLREIGQPDGSSFRQPSPLAVSPDGREVRSEEHTSELQSLMRISYAVFC